MSFYNVIYTCFKGLIKKVLYPTTVEGLPEHFPEGPVVLCPNHTGMADAIVLVAATPRQVNFMAKKELFSIPVLRGFLKAMGAFPIDRGKMDVASVKKGVSILREGNMLGIFPQGKRFPGVHPATTKDKLHNGIAMLSVRSQATIIPVSIISRKYKTALFRRVKVVYGKPIPYEEYVGIYEKNRDYRELTEYVFDIVCSNFEKNES